jgi:single-strand DNA-binding protein
MLNRYQFIGHLGNVADVRHTENGSAAIGFSVAVSESYTDKQGQKVENTTWVNCTIWKKQGESTKIADYLLKGTKVLVEGKPTAQAYQANNGESKASLNVKVDRVELLSSKSDQQQDQAQGYNTVSNPQRTDTERLYNPQSLAAENPFDQPLPTDASAPQDNLPF